MIDKKFVEKSLEITPEQAINIINHGRAIEQIDDRVSDDPKKNIANARNFIAATVDFWQADHGRGDDVRATLGLANLFEKPDTDGELQYQPPFESIVTSKEPEVEVEVKETKDEPKHLAGVQSPPAREKAVAEAKKSSLSEPPKPELEYEPEIPRDVSKLTDADLNQLFLDFNACLTRATYEVALATIDQKAYGRIAELAERKARKEVNPTREDGKKKTREDIDAEVATNDEVIQWRHAEGEASDQIVLFKALRDGYQASVDALSRVGGFRHEEAKRSNGGGPIR